MKQKQKITVKYLILQLHLYLGLISGIVVFIVALTGALFVFEEEGREAFQHKYYHVENVGTARVSLQQMTDTFKHYYPKEKITSIRFKEEKDAAFIYITKSQKAVSINPYTSQIIGKRDLDKDFFTAIQKIHTELLLGDVGKQIVHINVLIFFIMCISGLVLWWPKQKKFFKKAATINFKTKNWKRLNWDLHSVLGFYALLVLFVISLTGLFFAFDTTKNIVAFLTHGKVPKKETKMTSKPIAGKHFTMDSAYNYMTTNYPNAKETFITPAIDSAGVVRVLMRYPYTLVRIQNNVYFNQYTGKVLKAELYNDYKAYDNIAKANYDFHTGRIRALGIGSKIIYFLSALIAASLPVTGFIIWWGRRRKTTNKLKKREVVLSA